MHCGGAFARCRKIAGRDDRYVDRGKSRGLECQVLDSVRCGIVRYGGIVACENGIGKINGEILFPSFLKRSLDTFHPNVPFVVFAKFYNNTFHIRLFVMLELNAKFRVFIHFAHFDRRIRNALVRCPPISPAYKSGNIRNI